MHRCMIFAFWNASSCAKTKDFALTFARCLKFGVKLCINVAQGYAFARDNGFVSSFAQNYAHGRFVPSKKSPMLPNAWSCAHAMRQLQKVSGLEGRTLAQILHRT